ncbi:hypothetical protein TRFO_15549 [Tritrichomonas foetus]|uniref:Phosphoprotein phosphatase n=1 Tax=Tritrichomonas foetus TaxID=1144522 RepID=A0A1J4KWY2_9EUKA|nr:hypothetical protein TRFO_15549 [Tritrichomonas foetus]|eukprot:OHT14053.1 hypothetical protein TRFO_15549 [Tritrichomonas foetus]
MIKLPISSKKFLSNSHGPKNVIISKTSRGSNLPVLHANSSVNVALHALKKKKTLPPIPKNIQPPALLNLTNNSSFENVLLVKTNISVNPTNDQLKKDHRLIQRNELLEMLKELRNCVDYQVLTFPKHNMTRSAKILKAKTNLIIMLKAYQDAHVRNQLSIADRGSIFSVLMKHINHSYDRSLHKIIVPGEANSTFFLTNNDILNLIYDLFNLFIDQFYELLTHEQIGKIIEVFQSPVETELYYAQKLLTNIMKMNEITKDFVNTHLMRIFEDISDEGARWSIKHILALLRVIHFRGDDDGPSGDSIDSFNSYIFPLISLQSAVDFYQPFSLFSNYFYKNDSEVAYNCLTFLFSHWPVRSSHKQMIFLHQMQCILSSMDIGMLPDISSELLHILENSVTSENAKVSVMAITLINDINFLTIFITTNTIKNILFRALKIAEKHWNVEVRNKAFDALAKLVMVPTEEGSSMYGVSPRSLNVHAKEVWELIAKIASEKVQQASLIWNKPKSTPLLNCSLCA